jgi:TPR repeat protein
MDLAQTQLAHAYLAGKDVPRNLVDGFAWLALARIQWAPAGNEFDRFAKEASPEFLNRVHERVKELEALKQSAGGYFDDSVYASPSPPIEMLQRLAQQKVPLAQVRLAYAYQKGQGVALDLNTAIALYKRVEQDGPMELHLQIGVSYIDGQRGSQNYVAARDWLGRAAEEGSMHAARLLGELERDGNGGDPNVVNAAMWFLLAAVDGNARQDLDGLSSKLTKEQNQKARQLADIWRMKHPLGLH